MILNTFTDKYKNMSSPLKAAFWFTVCNFLQRGISMITTPIFTRVLSTEEYGLYSTYLSWENILIMIVTLSLYKAMLNLYVKYDDKEKVLSVVCGLELLLSIVWLIFGIAFRNVLATLLGISPMMVCCFFIYFIFQAVFYCWTLYKRYIYDYKKVVAVTLIMSVGSSFLGVFAVVFFNPTAEMRIISNTFVVMIIGIVLYVSIFKKNKPLFDKNIWPFSLGFCIPLLPHYLSVLVLQSFDKIMINYLCGPNDVAIYSIAYSVGSLINLVISAINSSFAPYQYQKIQSGEYTLLSKRANQVLLFIGVMLCGIMLFSREIVMIFGGKKYIESVAVIIPICLGVYFNYLFQLFARVQEYFERKLFILIPSVLSAVLNLILNYIFIKLCGYQAAAYTTFVCYLIFCILHYIFYRYICNTILNGKQLYDIKGIIIISIGIVISGFIIGIISYIPWLKYGLIIVFILVIIAKRKKIYKYIKMLLSK